jgi:predicted SAM-dependent methyltransferase
LNVGCGSKFNTNWVNVDMVSVSPDVIATNLIKGIPFPDNSFSVVYHSQVLEHIPRDSAAGFIRECYRVLKPGGILRVVVPDLENIVDEYKKYLNENLNNPSELAEANYNWVLLEMYDQTVRNYSGGQMSEYITQPNLINEEYITNRIGANRVNNHNPAAQMPVKKNYGEIIGGLLLFKPTYTHKLKQTIGKKFKNIFQSKQSKVGEFRLGGEVHMWMYDRFSLSQLLKKCGFEETAIKTPFESDIPKWSEYELDVKDGKVYDPTSLFIEGRKGRK